MGILQCECMIFAVTPPQNVGCERCLLYRLMEPMQSAIIKFVGDDSIKYEFRPECIYVLKSVGVCYGNKACAFQRNNVPLYPYFRQIMA